MKLYFVRHGQSEANILKIVYNRGDKYGLTEKGVEEVKGLVREFKEIKFDKIFTSPLLRAKQTAGIIAEALKLDYEITDSLREFDVGILNGTGDEKSFQLEHEIMQTWMVQNNWDARIEAGENYYDVKERFLNLIDQIKTKEYENIILVSHGGILQCMLPFIGSNLKFHYCHENLLKNANYAVLETSGDIFTCIRYGNAIKDIY